MLTLLKVRKARSLVREALGPFIDELQRNSEIEPGDWLHPGVIGFLATFATVSVQRRLGALSEHALGVIQTDILRSFTGLGADMVGAEISRLSAHSDPEFVEGAHGAIAFLDELWRSGPYGDLDARNNVILIGLWDEHVSRRLLQAHRP